MLVVCGSLLHGDSVKLLWNIVWCLVLLSSDTDTSNEIRSLGGIPLLLSMLQSVIHPQFTHSIASVRCAFVCLSVCLCEQLLERWAMFLFMQNMFRLEQCLSYSSSQYTASCSLKLTEFPP